MSTKAVPTPMEAWLASAATGASLGLYINGAWTAPTAKTAEVRNPARKDQVLVRASEASAADVERAVDAAAATFETWSRVSGPDRGAILFKAADLIERDAQELAFRLSAEQGKVLGESRGEVVRAVRELRFCAGEASRIDGDTLSSEKPGGLAMTLREPIGVVAAIAPWNFPVITPVRKVGPALAFGCTVVLKTASQTPWAAARLVELFSEAGLPAGALNLVTGAGSVCGNALINDRRVRGISFTGSTSIGLGVAQAAAKRLAKVQLELGGKNPAVVMSYTDASAVAKQVVSAAFACAGQRCTAISRVIVLDKHAAEITEALRAEMAKLVVGPAWDPAANVGPLVTAAHEASVRAYFDVAKVEGARIVAGGSKPAGGVFDAGHYLAPTLIDQVKADIRIAREEVFGPVLTVTTVPDFETALKVTNDVEYGLAACVFTRDIGEALRFVKTAKAGMVHVNHGTASEAHVPFGGVKASGAGPYSIGHSNLEFFTDMKVAYLT